LQPLPERGGDIPPDAQEKGILKWSWGMAIKKGGLVEREKGKVEKKKFDLRKGGRAYPAIHELTEKGENHTEMEGEVPSKKKGGKDRLGVYQEKMKENLYNTRKKLLHRDTF